MRNTNDFGKRRDQKLHVIGDYDIDLELESVRDVVTSESRSANHKHIVL